MYLPITLYINYSMAICMEFCNLEQSEIGQIRMLEPKEELNSLKLLKKVNIHDLQMAQILMITSVWQFSQWI